MELNLYIFFQEQVTLVEKNIHFFLQTIAAGEGELLVVRRPNERTSGDKFLPCTKCFGFFNIHALSSHRSKCPLIGKNEIGQHKNARGEALLMLTPYMARITELDALVLTGMKETKENDGEKMKG